MITRSKSKRIADLGGIEPAFENIQLNPPKRRRIAKAKIGVIKRQERDDANKCWDRVRDKFLMNKDVSPIKQIYASLKPTTKFISRDSRFFGLIWILSNSEQYHYDNAIRIVVSYMENQKHLAHALTNNFSPRTMDDYSINWVDVEVLGSGTFGDVIKVYDNLIGKKLAVKLLKNVAANNLTERAKVLLEYFKERNYLIKARNSSLIMQFYSSFESKKYGKLAMVYDFCIGDLSDYIDQIAYLVKDNYSIDEMIIDNDSEQYNEMVKELKDYLKFDITAVHAVFILECYMILDYLAQINLIHNDIKEMNLLISENGHLRLADFGLITNSEFLMNGNHVQLMTGKELSIHQISSHHKGGTSYYFDLELTIDNLQSSNFNCLDSISDPKIPYDVNANYDYEKCFMSDVWSMNLVIQGLTFFGIEAYETFSIRSLNALNLKKSNSANIIISLTNSKSKFKRFFDSYKAMISDIYKDLGDLIASSFEVRSERCKDYREEKMMRMHDISENMFYLAIDKVEKLKFFVDYNVNKTNATFYQMPNEMFKYIVKAKTSNKYKTFGEFLAKTVKGQQAKGYITLRPGIDISLDC